ncbi:MAG TPA: MraY family glycosyltransferase [Burkholderiales bacterium]
MTNSVLKYLMVFLVTAFLVKVFSATAIKAGLIDHPGGRKRHEGAVPLIGGLAMLAGFGFGALITLDSLYSYRALFAALGLLVIVGVLDDLHDLAPAKKFFAQIVAALFMTSWGMVTIVHLGDLFGFGTVALRGWSIPFTVICVLGVINAVNMADGVDGLAGGLAFITLVFMGIAAELTGQAGSARLLFVMAAAIAGFLVFNLRLPWQSRARVFMGDSGSMMLGLFLTWFAIALTQRGAEPLPPIVAVWFLAVPILDMGLVTVRRLAKGGSPFRAGRDHLHHFLMFAGYSPSRTVNLMLLFSLFLAAVGFIGWRMKVPEAALFYAFMALFVVYYLLSLRAWRMARLMRKTRWGK